MGPTFTPKSTPARVLLFSSLSWGGQQHTLQSLADSGAASNFIDLSLAKNLQIPLVNFELPLTVTALDRRLLGNGCVHHLTTPVHLSINNHQEK